MYMNKRQERLGWFSADYTAKQCLLNIIIPLHGGGLYMTIFQFPQSYVMSWRYAVLCRQSQACFFSCRTNWLDSNHPHQNTVL